MARFSAGAACVPIDRRKALAMTSFVKVNMTENAQALILKVKVKIKIVKSKLGRGKNVQNTV